MHLTLERITNLFLRFELYHFACHNLFRTEIPTFVFSFFVANLRRFIFYSCLYPNLILH